MVAHTTWSVLVAVLTVTLNSVGCKAGAKEESAVLAFVGDEACASRTAVMSTKEDEAVLQYAPSCPQSHGVLETQECQSLQGDGVCVVRGQAKKGGPTQAEYCLVRSGDARKIDVACTAAAALARRYVSLDECRERAKLIYDADHNRDHIANTTAAQQSCRFETKSIDPSACAGRLHAAGLCTVTVGLVSGESKTVCVRRDGPGLSIDLRCTEGLRGLGGAVRRLWVSAGTKYDEKHPATDWLAVSFFEQGNPSKVIDHWVRRAGPIGEKWSMLLKGKNAPVAATVHYADFKLLEEGHGQLPSEIDGEAFKVVFKEPGLSNPALALTPDGSLLVTSANQDMRILNLATGAARPVPGGASTARSAGVFVDGKYIFQSTPDASPNGLTAIDLASGATTLVVPLKPGRISAYGTNLATNSAGKVAWLQTTNDEYEEDSRDLYVADTRAKQLWKLASLPESPRVGNRALAMSDEEVFVPVGASVLAFAVSVSSATPRKLTVREDPLGGDNPAPVQSMVYFGGTLAMVVEEGISTVEPARPESARLVAKDFSCSAERSCYQLLWLVTDGARVLVIDSLSETVEELDLATGARQFLTFFPERRGGDGRWTLLSKTSLIWMEDGGTVVGWSPLPSTRRL